MHALAKAIGVSYPAVWQATRTGRIAPDFVSADGRPLFTANRVEQIKCQFRRPHWQRPMPRRKGDK